MQKKILIAALDWGLGHASRCVPIIQHLLETGCEPIIGSSGNALQLLKAEFPELQSIELPSYKISYPIGRGMMFKLAAQLPAVWQTILQEHKILQELITKENIGAVVSDNRYGLYNNKIPGIFITHQLFIKAPKGFSWGEAFVKRLNFSLISKFNECWIPDYAAYPNLSGALSHGKELPENSYYIGPLSRFKKLADSVDQNPSGKILIVLSGPEPQRSLLEHKILAQLPLSDGTFTLIRGLFLPEKSVETRDNITIISHLNSTELTEYMNTTDLVICRSGYSSIMDLATVSKQALLIPTPGQTEQEYLADYHLKRGNFYSQTQKALNICKAIPELKSFPGIKITPSNTVFKERIEQLIGKL